MASRPKSNSDIGVTVAADLRKVEWNVLRPGLEGQTESSSKLLLENLNQIFIPRHLKIYIF